jgi:hypothetical protein
MIQPHNKPTGVRVFGTLNIVFGLIGLAFSSVVIRQLIGAWRSPGAATEYKLFLLTANCIAFGFAVWLTVLGVGLLRMRAWARRGSIIYCLLGIALFVVETSINFVSIAAGWISIPPGAMAEFSAGLALGSIGGLIYPALLLHFMMSFKVKTAFTEEAAS